MPVRPTILTTAAGDYGSPRWSPDGERLLTGHTSIHVWDREGWTLNPAPPPVPNTHWHMARWYGDGEIIAFAATAAGDPVAMFVLPPHLGRPRPVNTVDLDATRVKGFEVINRTDVVWIRASDGALYLNGLRQGYPADHYQGLATDGSSVLTTTEDEWIVYAKGEAVYTKLEARNLDVVLRRSRPAEAHDHAIVGREIVYGNGDRVWLYRESARDVTVTPWGRERLPLLRKGRMLLWIWTVSERLDGTPLILGRGAGDRRAIVLDGIAAQAFDVRFNHEAECWMIAAYADHEGHGRPGLIVCAVPVDAPRETLV
jgi:dipeptidyl aminopeptidase/acylaminoacyl peptidase